MMIEKWILAFLFLVTGMSANASLANAQVGAELIFTDYHLQKPGQFHHLRPQDLPQPAPSTSVDNGAKIVKRPTNAWPQVPPGFQVQLYATGLDNPRLLRTAPNGDIFLAESNSGKIKVFRGITSDGKPEQTQIFASGLNRPYGIAFYPTGPQPQWIYIANKDAIVRYPYQNGDLQARGTPQKITSLPSDLGWHWTRDIQFSPDGKKLFVSVGSASNADDPDTHPEEKNRAAILVMKPDGSQMRIYADGIRNAGGGLAINPLTGELWCSVNERDGLGDNLVPDYITHVQEGGFYGWPWWYVGGHQDPRRTGKHPELKAKLIEPDVLLQPHNASLQLTFYTGKQFPAQYFGDIFAAQHGSWNRSVRTGYELIRIPLHQTGKATGEYEDFMTGFVIDKARVWGRPVGVTVAPDGSLLVSDDGSNSIWRIVYTGSKPVS
ncbi:sorbosone dehydrogenase family protein [Legionella sp.]|uniref:PQQ-dependent sugar dehydrogenase n=1 Tax=Legionella sp. TaxID=459 RepID=UPI00321FF9AF